MLAILFYTTDIKKLQSTITKIGVLKFLLLSVLYMVSQLISSIRWHFVIKSLKENLPSLWLFKIYLIGMYANLFLPSIIGGDAVKAYILSRKIPFNKAVSSIFSERYNGLLALLFISLTSSLIFSRFFSKKIIAIIVLINIFAYISVYAVRFFAKYEKIAVFYNNITLFHKSRYFFVVSVLSFFVQAFVILIYAVSGSMLGFSINWAYYFAFIPIINLISFLPVSFNGIGVREFSFVFFFSFAGLNKTEALSLSIEVFFVTVFCSLIGGLVYFFDGYNYKEVRKIYNGQ